MTTRQKRRMATDFDSPLDDMHISNGYVLIELAKKAEAEREVRRVALGMPRGFPISEKPIPATRAPISVPAESDTSSGKNTQ